MDSIEGTYKVEKHESRIRLIKADDNNSVNFLDYFVFVDRLYRYFTYETVETITKYVCEHKKLIIDFDNKKALLVKDKMPNFDNIFRREFDAKTVEKYYESTDNDFGQTNYSKTILGVNEDVEPIY